MPNARKLIRPAAEQEHGRRLGNRRDLLPRVLGLDGVELTVEGWVVRLGVRTEPFSKAFLPRGGELVDECVGTVMERDCLHNESEFAGQSREKQTVVMLLPDLEGTKARRRTLVTLTPFLGRDFTFLVTRACRATEMFGAIEQKQVELRIRRQVASTVWC